MDFIPELVDGGVVLFAADVCHSSASDCRSCPDAAVAIHNWLMATDIGYLIVDFQDEKDVCRIILEELLQLRKRLHLPFLFAGLMEQPKHIVQSYAYRDYPFFVVPEDAVALLKERDPQLFIKPLKNVVVGKSLPGLGLPHPKSGGDEGDSDPDASDDDKAL